MSKGEVVGPQDGGRTIPSHDQRGGIQVRARGPIRRIVATAVRGTFKKWRALGSLRWSWIGAIGTTLLATVVPALLGQVTYSALVALSWAGTLAIIFTAGYAAENLKAFRKAREDENSPKFDVSVVRAYEGGKGVYKVSLLNIGSGMAARVEASLWWMDSDLAMWLPSRVEGLSDLLLSGVETQGRVEAPWVRLATQRVFRPDVPALVLQVRYSSPIKEGVQEDFYPYDLGEDNAMVPSLSLAPSELRSLAGKQQLLNEGLAKLSEIHSLAQQDMTISGEVSGRVQTVTLSRGGEILWMISSAVDEPVYHIIDSADQSLRGPRKEKDSAGGKPDDDDGHGEDSQEA